MASNRCTGSISGYNVYFTCPGVVTNSITFSPIANNQYHVTVGDASFTIDFNSRQINNNSPTNIYMPEFSGSDLTFTYRDDTHFSHYTVVFDSETPFKIHSASVVTSNAPHAENPFGHSPMLSPSHPMLSPSHPMLSQSHPLNNPNHPLNNPNHPLNRRNHSVESFKNMCTWNFWNWLWFLIIVLIVVYLIYYFAYKKKTIDFDM